jgi:cytochrome c556
MPAGRPEKNQEHEMKTITTTALTLVLLLATSVMFSTGQNRKSRATKEFMRDKLELSQKILEGLANEDYDLMTAKAARLAAMSQEAGWQVFENPDYADQSVAFRQNVEALIRAARRKNLDGATLAFVRITMNCVDCHKFVRGKLVASWPPSPANPGL